MNSGAGGDGIDDPFPVENVVDVRRIHRFAGVRLAAPERVVGIDVLDGLVALAERPDEGGTDLLAVEFPVVLELTESLVGVLSCDTDCVGDFGSHGGFSFGDGREVLLVVVFGLEVPAVVAVVLARTHRSREQAVNDLLRGTPVW
jgi:hypothetical protein